MHGVNPRLERLYGAERENVQARCLARLLGGLAGLLLHLGRRRTIGGQPRWLHAPEMVPLDWAPVNAEAGACYFSFVRRVTSDRSGVACAF